MKTNRAPRASIADVALTQLAPVLWGTTYVTITELMPAGRPITVALLRVLPAGLLLATVGVVFRRWRPRGGQWPQIALLGMLNFGLFFPLLIIAVDRLPGGVAAAVGGIQPLLVASIDGVVDRRAPSRRVVLLGVVAIVGVGLVVIRPGAGIDVVGVLAAAGANVSFAAGVVATRRLPALPHRVAAAGWQLLVAGAVIGPLALVVDGPLPALTGRNLVGIAHLSLVATALAFAVWFRGVRRLPAHVPPLLGLGSPVTGAVMGWLVLGQDLSVVQLAGFVVTLAAIAAGTRTTVDASAPLRSDGRHRPRLRSSGWATDRNVATTCGTGLPASTPSPVP